MPGLMTIGSSRRLELTDGEQVLFVESSSSPMLEAAGSRPASQLTKAKRRVMSVTSEAALTGSGGATAVICEGRENSAQGGLGSGDNVRSESLL